MFRKRTYQAELLDNESIDRDELFRNLKELHVINRNLGGYAVSGSGLRALLKKNPSSATVLDIGFGGGDFIREMEQAGKGVRRLFFYGVDLKQDCFDYATSNLNSVSNKKLFCCDYRDLPEEVFIKADIVHCSLFIHHLTDEQIVDLFRTAKKFNCALLINDLHRHWAPYYSIRLLTSLFSKSTLVKNDAPLSVRRGFRKNEIVELLARAGYKDFRISWRWAFRYLITAT